MPTGTVNAVLVLAAIAVDLAGDRFSCDALINFPEFTCAHILLAAALAPAVPVDQTFAKEHAAAPDADRVHVAIAVDVAAQVQTRVLSLLGWQRL
jgi:hypothetical protein